MKIRYVGVLIIFFCVSLLSACIPEVLIFSGESDNWSVHYEVIKSENPEINGKIRYIGTNPIPKRLEYTIYKDSGDVPLNDNGVYTTGRCIGCSAPNKHMEIEAIIKWDNKSEIIPLIVE